MLCVGSELSETDFWDTSAILEQNLIRIDIDPGSLARPHTADIAILGDARAALDQLEPMINKRNTGTITPEEVLQDSGDQARNTIVKALEVIRASLPEETIVASDMTQIAYIANEVFPVLKPHTYIHPWASAP